MSNIADNKYLFRFIQFISVIHAYNSVHTDRHGNGVADPQGSAALFDSLPMSALT